MSSTQQTAAELLAAAGIDPEQAKRPAPSNGNGAAAVDAEALEALRNEALDIVAIYPEPVEQGLALRRVAERLSLPNLTQQDIARLLSDACFGTEGPPELLTNESRPMSMTTTPWLLEGIVMARALNLVVALPKVGKSALALGFIGAWVHGQQTFLGQALPGDPCPPVLIIGSDQPENDWARMFKQFGLLTADNRQHPRIVGLATADNPWSLDTRGIERIAAIAADNPGLLVVIDSYHACTHLLGLKEEAAEMATPARELMAAVGPHAATVLLIHHASKGRASEGAVAASRGSTALPAAASQTITASPTSRAALPGRPWGTSG